jgi:hypothetical protein
MNRIAKIIADLAPPDSEHYAAGVALTALFATKLREASDFSDFIGECYVVDPSTADPQKIPAADRKLYCCHARGHALGQIVQEQVPNESADQRRFDLIIAHDPDHHVEVSVNSLRTVPGTSYRQVMTLVFTFAGHPSATHLLEFAETLVIHARLFLTGKINAPEFSMHRGLFLYANTNRFWHVDDKAYASDAESERLRAML